MALRGARRPLVSSYFVNKQADLSSDRSILLLAKQRDWAEYYIYAE